MHRVKATPPHCCSARAFIATVLEKRWIRGQERRALHTGGRQCTIRQVVGAKSSGASRSFDNSSNALNLDADVQGQASYLYSRAGRLVAIKRLREHVSAQMVRAKK